MPIKNTLQSVLLFLKGIAMGAADVVPGVSGGTIAFISGIYEELITTIHRLNFSFFKLWKKQGFIAAWQFYNLRFLALLFGGVFFSLLLFAKIIGWLLINEPIALWSFFFGLILASVVYIGRMIRPWNFGVVAAIITAAFVAYFITLAEPVASPESLWFLFFAGFIAIIAMILPGISGSFILLLIGAYEVFLGSINQFSEGLTTANFEMVTTALIKLITFGLGAIVGLKVFSGVLNWLFKNYKNITLAVLTGFMLGALNKIWPWKEVLSYRTNSKGEIVPFLEKSVTPANFEGDPQLMTAFVFMIIGFILIFILEGIANKYKTNFAGTSHTNR